MQHYGNALTIGALAQAAGVNVETIRYYQRKGLMSKPQRAYGSIRRYADADHDRVRFIKASQRLGFSLEEVAELLKLEDGTHCTETRDLASKKLQDVRLRLANLRSMEKTLSHLVARCDATQSAVQCPLIKSLLEIRP